MEMLANRAGHRCGIAAALDVVGDRWALLIVREVFYGNRRFSGIARILGAPRDRLAARLKSLVETGVLERVEYQAAPARHEYHLTEAGADLAPVLLALLGWGDRWIEGTEPLTRHGADEHRLRPVVTCAECGEPVRAQDVARRFPEEVG
jgi:DNA-binding HxlR family transcriptional regulator